MKVAFASLSPPPPATMITFFTSSGCKLCFLFPGVTHSQEAKNHNKQQFHLLVFSDDRMISKETEKQNEACNQRRLVIRRSCMKLKSSERLMSFDYVTRKPEE